VHEDVTDREIVRIARELRRPVDLGTEVDVAVMAAIRAAPLMVAGRAPTAKAAPARRPDVLRWLTRARTVRLHISPVGALAAAGIAVAALLGLRRVEETRLAEELRRTNEHGIPGQTGEHRVAQGAVRKTDTVYVTRFMLLAPTAKQVALAGDFNDWDTSKTQLVKNEQSGLWTATVSLPPGRYSYAFVVDGERWVADPRAPRAVGDDFGRPSSTVTVREAQSL
jgi:hypothetical protein